MKTSSLKLFQSAFALSLTLALTCAFAQTENIDEFLGLDSEIKEPISAPADIKVTPESVEIELPVLPKGQKHSLIPWSSQEPDDWLDVKKWIIDRERKDKDPDWKTRLRYLGQNELMGRVLSCRGSCKVFQGMTDTRAVHLSRIHEGDEVITGKDTVMWIFLNDGTLVRLSADTSVSFLEINIGEKDVFYQARLNQGHLFWHPRNKDQVKIDEGAETDAYSLPLMVREANQEYFERKIFADRFDWGRLNEVISVNENQVKAQFDQLNLLKTANNAGSLLSSTVLMVAPNASIMSRDSSFDLVYVPGGKAYYKKRSEGEEAQLALQFRGYEKVEDIPATETTWFEVDSLGRNQGPATQDSGHLEILSLLTSRIKTVELAREMWVEKYTAPIMKAHSNPQLLASEFGYNFWKDDLNKRIIFLSEYTRRIETTHLKSVENLLAKLENGGTAIRREISDDSYQSALNHYLFGLKKRYTNEQMRVREMSDLQYYVWILRNGKF